jgi:hypothetical protein
MKKQSLKSCQKQIFLAGKNLIKNGYNTLELLDPVIEVFLADYPPPSVVRVLQSYKMMIAERNTLKSDPIVVKLGAGGRLSNPKFRPSLTNTKKIIKSIRKSRK